MLPFFHRYVVVKIIPENDVAGSLSITDNDLYSSILKSVQKYYGDLGAASIRFGIKCKYCNDQTRIAIIRAKHIAHRFVTSILPMTSVVSDKRTSICILMEMLKNKYRLVFEFHFLFCFNFLGQLGSHTIKYRILYNGATIMQCNKFIVEYQKKYLDEHVGAIVSANQRNKLVKNVMEISTVTKWFLVFKRKFNC